MLERGLKVMDATAISLCMDNKLPIVVFNLRQAGNLRRVIMGEPVGTTVDGLSRQRLTRLHGCQRSEEPERRSQEADGQRDRARAQGTRRAAHAAARRSSLLDPVQVEAYGTTMPLNQVASLSVPEPTLIVAQPFDPSLMSAIERGIQKSNLGLNPASDGKVDAHSDSRR